MRNYVVYSFLIVGMMNSVSVKATDEGLVAWWKFDEIVEARPNFEEAKVLLNKVLEEKTQITIQDTWDEVKIKAHQEARDLAHSLWEDVFTSREEDIRKGFNEGNLTKYLRNDLRTLWRIYSEQTDEEIRRERNYMRDVWRELSELAVRWRGKAVVETISQERDKILRNFWLLPGVSGDGVKFDGFTTHITRKAADAPQLGDAFTFEAWIVPQAYPWNWGAIINQESDRMEGYFFGIDAEGHVGLHLAVDGRWYESTTEATIPFMEKWSHITGTFDANLGITIYINGEQASFLSIQGLPTYASNTNFQIGRNLTPLPPAALVREWLSIPASYSFDGIIDELKIYKRAKTAEEIRASYEKVKPIDAPTLDWRKLPQLPEGTSPFKARYTNLKFYPEWDLLWRVSDHPDIVVTFDELPGKMVFWRGTNYNMNLVTENGRWVGDQSAETGGNWELSQGSITDFPTGCMEHMSDKHNRYAHVRVIENHDARVVVHWRYALNDVQYKIANSDSLTGWGDWADEYYYIYPDGVSIRSATIHGFADGYSLTEPATFNNPGEKAEDNVDIAAVTVANMSSEVKTYVWDPWPKPELRNGNICIVNFKSEYKPFYIFEPGARIGPYGAPSERRPEYSLFPTWNHWPVSQIPSDGRYALASDRVSSSAILSPAAGMKRETPGDPMRARFIMGITNKPIQELFPLAQSWLNTPQLELKTDNFSSEGYSRDQRAYIIQKESSQPFPLELTIAATEKSPIKNPAFVIKDWGDTTIKLKVNRKIIKPGKLFRYGFHSKLKGTDLIIWIKTESKRPLLLSIYPKKGSIK